MEIFAIIIAIVFVAFPVILALVLSRMSAKSDEYAKEIFEKYIKEKGN